MGQGFDTLLNDRLKKQLKKPHKQTNNNKNAWGGGHISVVVLFIVYDVFSLEVCWHIFFIVFLLSCSKKYQVQLLKSSNYIQFKVPVILYKPCYKS